jgi:hypothetical protein
MINPFYRTEHFNIIASFLIGSIYMLAEPPKASEMRKIVAKCGDSLGKVCGLL